jgi:hypothetical protein
MCDIPRPIIGFVGSIDDCNPDIDFLAEVADLLPDMSFVLVGRSQMDCSNLESRKNVRMLGQKPYEQVPEYGKRFDVAVLPLRQSRWADAVNPLKLKEYLALGKPVVSTPFPELCKYSDVVYEAETPVNFAACIKRAIAEDSTELIARRREKVKNSSWDSKAEQVLKELYLGGGHLTELLKLSSCWGHHEIFFITTVPVVHGNLRELGDVYIVGECNRKCLLHLIIVLSRCVKIIFKKKPDVVISTGAAAGCMLCFLGKMLGAKVVWIDSITNVERISLSGRMVRYVADLFLVQWPELANRYKKVEYIGVVI